jgi:hypothetical protein
VTGIGYLPQVATCGYENLTFQVCYNSMNREKQHFGNEVRSQCTRRIRPSLSVIARYKAIQKQDTLDCFVPRNDEHLPVRKWPMKRSDWGRQKTSASFYNITLSGFLANVVVIFYNNFNPSDYKRLYSYFFQVFFQITFFIMKISYYV